MNNGTIKKYLRYVIVVLAGLLIIGAVYFATMPKNEADSTETDPTETEMELPTASALDIAKIKDLIRTYYNAKVENDADTLNRIVETDTPYTLTNLSDEGQFIAKYDAFKTYVIPGLTGEFFVVYVTYDIYFQGIETGAPALNHFIVAKDTEGDFLIYDRPVSAEFNEYIEGTEKTADIQKLSDEVEESLQKACDKDPDLRELIMLLSGNKGETENTPAETSGEPEQDNTDSADTTAAGNEAAA